MNISKGHKVCIFLILLNTVVNTYEIPKPKIEAYSPKGIKISIPDVPGISFMGFHGELNTELHATQNGNIFGETRTPINGFWVYENDQTVVHKMDVLHFWMFVQYERFGYRLDDQRFVIRDLIDRNKKPTRPTRPIPTQGTIIVSRGPSTDSPTQAPTQPPTPRPPTPRPPTIPPIPASCLSTITTVRGLNNICKGQLIFEDHFNTLDRQKWKKEIKIPLDTEDAEFNTFQDFPQNCYTSDGILYILPKLLTEYPGFTDDSIKSRVLNFGPSCTGVVNRNYECARHPNTQFILPPVVSCQINTKSSFSFIYGKVEIRAKFPKGDWILPQLFLDPTENLYGSNDFASGQLRIGFIRGNEALISRQNSYIDGSVLSGGMILSRNATVRDLWMKTLVLDRHTGDDYHNYSLTWSDQSISVAVDGTPYAFYKPNFRNQAFANNIQSAPAWNISGFMAPFDKEFYLTLGVSVGGMSDFPDLSRTGTPPGLLKPWSNTSPKAEYYFWTNKTNWYPTWRDTEAAMKIDYVKVWAL